MKQMNIITSWYADFKCVGADCPYDCCRDWSIDVTKEEIDDYSKLQHTFSKNILESLDVKNRKFKLGCDGHCALFREDGLCDLVIHCGDEWLSGTCRQFPRHTKNYGIISDWTVEIGCPIVAQRLFDEAPLEFSISENDSDEEAANIDYSLFQALTRVRAYLIDLFQTAPGKYFYGKIYIAYSLVLKIRMLIKDGGASAKSVLDILQAYQAESVVLTAFSDMESQAENIERRLQAIKNTGELQNIFEDSLRKYNVKRYEPQARIIGEWMRDENLLSDAVRRFSGIWKTEYDVFSEKYFTHSFFFDLIESEPQAFGEKVLARIPAYTVLMLNLMAIWNESGDIPSRENTSVLVSIFERFVMHGNEITKRLGEEMTARTIVDLFRIMY